LMGCSPDPPTACPDGPVYGPVYGPVARGRAGPSPPVFPLLVGSDPPSEVPTGSETPPALAVGSLNH
jgi:hypothetical protein